LPRHGRGRFTDNPHAAWRARQAGGPVVSSRAEPLRDVAPADVEALARQYAPALRRFFQRRSSEPADVDDLVQEVFLRLTRRGDLAGVDNLEGYVFQTAANVLRDRARRRATHRAHAHQPIGNDQVEGAAFSPERVLLGREAVGQLRAALLALPPRTRDVFFLGRIEGLGYAEIASRLGISLSAVNKHMAKALEFLMDRVQDDPS
jgi:RNA polymerase sigma-70 factor (ECF subfamily)